MWHILASRGQLTDVCAPLAARRTTAKTGYRGTTTLTGPETGALHTSRTYTYHPRAARPAACRLVASAAAAPECPVTGLDSVPSGRDWPAWQARATHIARRTYKGVSDSGSSRQVRPPCLHATFPHDPQTDCMQTLMSAWHDRAGNALKDRKSQHAAAKHHVCQSAASGCVSACTHVYAAAGMRY